MLGREAQPAPDSDLAWSVRRPRSSLFNSFAPDAASGRGVLGVLGQSGLVSEANWPKIERDLLVEDTVTLVVQVNGKETG